MRLITARLRIAGVLGDAEYVNVDILARACCATNKQNDDRGCEF